MRLLRYSRPSRLRALALALVLFGFPFETRAQDQPDPSSEGRIRVGPLYLTPLFTIRDIGTDSNVFNDAENPVQDFSATVNPQIVGGLRLGPARVTLGSSVGFVYYQHYKSQDSVNTQQNVQIDLPLARLRPFVAAEFLSTRARPGFEIDARARRVEPTVKGGTELKVSDKTSIAVSMRRTRTEFAEGERFLNTDLHATLNRRLDVVSGSLRIALTPLTTFVFLSEGERTRFDFNPLRDSNGLRASAGFEFQPDALFRGEALVGFRSLKPLAAGVPEYRGIAAAIGLGYTLRGATKVEGRFDRDVAYSLDDVTPYYLATGGNITVTQRIVGPFDVTGTVGRQLLDYRALQSAASGRRDRVDLTGGGIGYRIGEAARIGINFEYSQRTTNTRLLRGYDRTRIFASMTYEFK